MRKTPPIRSRKKPQATQPAPLDGDLQPKLVTYYSQQEHIITGLVMVAHHTPISQRHQQILPLICRMPYLLYSDSATSAQDNVPLISRCLFVLLDENEPA